jgi:hypothetical protein
MSEDRLYIRFKGKILGPLTSQKIQELARRGQITRMHDLSPDGRSWVKAGEYGNLFNSDKAAEQRPASGDGYQAAPIPVNPLYSQAAPVAPAPAVSRPTESPDLSVQWYAHINGENRGPLTTASLMSSVNSGQVAPDTLVWRAGFDDWRPAGDCFPQSFSQPTETQTSATGENYVKVSTSGGTRDLYYELQVSRPWALLIGWLSSVTGVLSSIYWIVFMIVGSNLPFTGSLKVIIGLGGLTFAGILIFGGVLVLRYAASLKDIAIHRSEARAIETARRLAAVWRLLGITVLIVLGLAVGGTILMLVIGAGIGAGAL